MNKYFIIWLAAISVVSVVVCLYDKFAAKHNPKHRTREATLLLLSALGGSLAMFLTMQIIHRSNRCFIPQFPVYRL